MLFRSSRLWVATGLLLTLWGLDESRQSDSRVWISPLASAPGPVRILRFYASTGALMVGQRAMLCYGVENARSVTISPLVQGIYPSPNHCVEVVPEHTTHYTLMAEGFDGRVATQSFTLPVQPVPIAPQVMRYAIISKSPAAPTGA